MQLKLDLCCSIQYPAAMCNVLQDENTLMRNQGREELKLEAKEHSTRYREGHSEKLQQ